MMYLYLIFSVKKTIIDNHTWSSDLHVSEIVILVRDIRIHEISKTQ